MPSWVIPAVLLFVALDGLVIALVLTRMRGGLEQMAPLALKGDELVSAAAEVMAGSVNPGGDPDTVAAALAGLRPQLEEMLRARGLEPSPVLLRLLARGALKQLGCGPRLIAAGVRAVAA